MRKAFALLLALVLLTSAGAVYAVRELSAPADQILFTETTLYGDLLAADGLQARKTVQLNGKLAWDSTLQFNHASYSVQTDFRYSKDIWNDPRYQDDHFPLYEGVFVSDILANSYETTGSDLSGMADGLEPAQDELIAETPNGQERTKTVCLSDYYEYYPILTTIDLPGLLYGGYPEIMEQNPYESPEVHAIQAVQDFLKIPVLDSQRYTIGIEKGEDGEVYRSWGSSLEDGDSFCMCTQCAVSDDACYFYFRNRTDRNKLVDTSHIPGGYGIYILPYGTVSETDYYGYDFYEGCDVFTDELRVFYPVDPQTEILDLTLSDNQKTLLLHTMENGAYIVTVISTETGDTLQRFELAQDAGDLYTETERADEAVIVRIGDSFSVLSRKSDTEWELKYQTSPIGPELEEFFAPMALWHGRAFAFDGERLAVISGSDPDGDYTNCGFTLAVYNSDGLQYYGVFDSTLSQANTGAVGAYPGNGLVCDVDYPNRVTWSSP